MSELKRIKNILRAVSEKQPWYGDNVLKVLKSVSAEQAAYKPSNKFHSIWEIFQHMINWRIFALKRIEGLGDYDIILNSEIDWPTISDTSEENWEKTIAHYKQLTEQLQLAIEGMEEAQLEEVIPGNRNYKFYVLLHGIIQHDVYHLGQISLLKKMV